MTKKKVAFFWHSAAKQREEPPIYTLDNKNKTHWISTFVFLVFDREAESSHIKKASYSVLILLNISCILYNRGFCSLVVFNKSNSKSATPWGSSDVRIKPAIKPACLQKTKTLRSGWVWLVCPAVTSVQIFPVVGEQFISVSHEEKYIPHAHFHNKS